MPEIEIKIKIGDQADSIYRFTEFPIEIGRSSDCHLSIRHEAIARKLCRVWVAPNGGIHLEARPNLTNPLFESGKVVFGGICKTELRLTIGPVTLAIRNPARPAPPTGKALGPPVFLGAIALGVIALIFLLPDITSSSVRHHRHRQDFPATVPIQNPDTRDQSSMPLNLMAQLAISEYTRQSDSIQKRKHAVELMWQVEKRSAPNSESHRQARAMRKAWHAELNKNYRLEIISLFNALDTDDSQGIRNAAARLNPYLDDSPKNLIKWLQQLERYGD
ncbi:MAG: hypothetical protein JXX14_24105 [Deltaproteobacteria bacterium]|nr:hypothetical protein [Deltaproteobacteria bacterium]